MLYQFELPVGIRFPGFLFSDISHSCSHGDQGLAYPYKKREAGDIHSRPQKSKKKLALILRHKLDSLTDLHLDLNRLFPTGALRPRE